MRASHAAVLVLTLALVVPGALADHVFSHRIYLVGRVVDAQGLPVAGAPIEITPSFRVGGACFDSKPNATRAQGEFEICRHAHALPENASLKVVIEGVERELPMDPDLRLVSLHLQLPGPARTIDLTGVREFNRTYVVAGRHFARVAEPIAVEGVLVNGTPLAGNVTARMTAAGSVVAEGNASPDEHGDFEIVLDIGTIPEGALVHVESGREMVEETASPLFRRSDVLLVRDDRLREGPGQDAPGSEAPKVVLLPPWTLLGALGLSAIVWRHGRRARRR